MSELSPTDTVEGWYRRHRMLVYGSAIRIVGSISEAEDIVQLVFLKALRESHRFRGGNVEGWLTTLARNCSLDALRRRRRESLAYGRCHIAEPLATGVEAQVLHKVDCELVRVALSKLRDDQRRLLVASFYEGISHRRLADDLQVPLGTIKTRIRGGLSRLRNAIAPEPI